MQESGSRCYLIGFRDDGNFRFRLAMSLWCEFKLISIVSWCHQAKLNSNKDSKITFPSDALCDMPHTLRQRRGCPPPHPFSTTANPFPFPVLFIFHSPFSSSCRSDFPLFFPSFLSRQDGTVLFFCYFNLSHYIKKREGKFPLFGFLHVEVLAQILVSERSGAPLGPVETVLSGPLGLLLGSGQNVDFPIVRGLFIC